ncbi:MAG: S41 family peptidase [Myxococcota bacterium]
MSKLHALIVAAMTTLVLTASPLPALASGLLRYPDVRGDTVVFSSGGDLWSVSTEGGTARRLTSHSGLELFAKLSPDGQMLAFTGQYSGDEQVYVMPVGGGEPRQLTYYPARGPLPARWGFDHQVYGFTPDGRQVLFRGLREHWTLAASRLYTVPVDGGAPVALAPPVAGAGDLSPDGRRLLYSPLFRDFRTWKRYQGGWAQDLYVYDLEGGPIQRITDHPRADRDPMWIGDALYFASDRGGRMNLYRYDLKTKATQPLTQHQDADVRWPSADPDGQIVYELSGGLRLYDTGSGRDRALDIQVPDEGLASRPRHVSVAGHMEGFELSPNGKRALVVARGDVFDVPTEHGLTRNLTHSSNAHEREAQWSPDGTAVAFISDVTGEEELWVRDQESGRHRQLTFRSKVRMYRPRWSPDALRIAYADAQANLWVVDLKSRKRTKVATDPGGRLNAFEWSPRGGFLAFTRYQANDFGVIDVWSVADGRVRTVTNPAFDVGAPAWGPKGDYLYYLSTRDFRPQVDAIDFNVFGSQANGVYATALRPDVENLYRPRDDALIEKKEAKADQSPKKEEPPGTGVDALRKQGFIKIAFEGIDQRVVQVPMKTSNYVSLFVTPTHVVAHDRGPFFLGRDDNQQKLVAFEISKRKLEPVATGITGYAVSADNSRVLVRTKKGLQVVALGKKGPDAKPKPLPTKGMKAHVVPKQEWMVIFDEVWRRYRDYFYVSNMHGFDWKAIRDRYRPLALQAGHREELNDVMGQMVAELEVSHAYVAGGDLGLPPRPGVALLGARFALDKKAGRYRIQEIYQGHNEEAKYRSPLTEVGVNAEVGEYVLEINGQELLPDDNPYRLLRGAVASPVELLLNQAPKADGARRVLVKPIGSEQPLVYLGWVLDKQARVDKATDGKIGYIHIPDMGQNGIYEFMKWFRPQMRKEGLIVDVRSNGGGFVSQLIIERLRRKVLGTGFSRHSQFVSTYPYAVVPGPMVCLMSETSASDGDIFPWAFRASGLGPLIGKKSWGGVVGITSHGPLLDGGSVFVPEFSTNGPEGAYIIEGEGVEPDIVVENDPVAVAAGRDSQLERGVKEVMARHKEAKRLPKRPAPPVHR